MVNTPLYTDYDNNRRHIFNQNESISALTEYDLSSASEYGSSLDSADLLIDEQILDSSFIDVDSEPEESIDIEPVEYQGSITNIVLSQHNTDENRRIYEMVNLRCRLADSYLTNTPCIRELTVDNKYIRIYSKGLEHDNEGIVNIEQINILLYALNTHNIEELGRLNSKLLNPSAAWSTNLIGPCNNSYRYSKIPNYDSDIIQLYAMSLVRDVPFTEYQSMSDLYEYFNTTPDNIFRVPIKAATSGCYLSKLLQNKKYRLSNICTNYLTNWEEVINIQSNPNIKYKLNTTYKTINTGRDLAYLVYNYDPIEFFSNIANDMIGSPFNESINRLVDVEIPYINFGKIDIQSTLYICGRNALSAAWYVKWNTLVPRPEAYGIEIERVFRFQRNKYGVSPKILNNPLIKICRTVNKTALLSQVYQEGAPLCPAMVSGYATAAGACVTVLKFFFGQFDELDKLASNIAIARCWAGVNFQSNIISGLKRGETVALATLKELIHQYPIKLEVLIRKFNEKEVIITNKY